MYNMDISIFGYKLNLEVLILIGIVYLILVGHTFCGCCNFGLIEGMDTNTNMEPPTSMEPPTNMDPSANMMLGTETKKKEGFVGANINYGESSLYNLSNDNPINTSSWSKPNMTVVPVQPLSQGVKNFLARKPQPVPLPEGEMLMFANTPFKPECCPNTYSNSMGCACMTGAQYNYLQLRGSNNVPYSEY